MGDVDPVTPMNVLKTSCAWVAVILMGLIAFVLGCGGGGGGGDSSSGGSGSGGGGGGGSVASYYYTISGAVTVLRSTDSAPIASASILITVHNSKSGGTTTGTVTTNTKGIATWSFNGANPTFNYPVDAFKVWDAQATVSGFATGSVLQIPVTTFVFDNDTTHNSTNNNCTIYLTPH
jgi:hypothetical protein